MSDRLYSIAIDGPAGAGKSTIARKAAQRLNFVYVDTGAIYRTLAYGIHTFGLSPEDEKLTEILSTFDVKPFWTEDGLQHMVLNGEDVTQMIRQPHISDLTSKISAIAAVRDFLMETQRKIAREYSVIMDGRDIGTVVLPDADVKIFLFASAEVRAKRRYLELQQKGVDQPYGEVLQEMIDRDYRDSHRAVAPLKPAADSYMLDTSDLDLEQSIEAVISIIRKKTGI